MLTLEDAKKKADFNKVDVPKCEVLLQEIIDKFQTNISTKYRTIFYLAGTGTYSAEDVAQIYDHNPQNMNSNFNKNLGQYLKVNFDLEENERVGITSLRRLLFKKGYLKKLDKAPNISNRHQDNHNSIIEGESL